MFFNNTGMMLIVLVKDEAMSLAALAGRRPGKTYSEAVEKIAFRQRGIRP